MAVIRNQLGKLDEQVSRLGFGCMRLPTQADGKIDRAQVAKMFDYAIQNGVNYFDTAFMYHNGESEVVVGETLARYDRSQYYVTTKLPVMMIKDMAKARECYATQRERLKLDKFDHYLLHGLNAGSWKTVKELGLIDYMFDLKAKGEIGAVGFSFHDEYALFDEIINSAPWDLCQIQYNYLDEQVQAGTKGYELCKEKGIPMVIMEPIRGGALAKLTDDLEAEYKRIDPERSIASWALRWVKDHDNCRVTLSGMSNFEQVVDNINTFSDPTPLSAEELAAIANTVKVMEERVANGCTGCRYCQPCPNGVDIPAVFRYWNTYTKFRQYSMVSRGWDHMHDDAKPDNCVECGQCEDICPQHLNIRDDLKKAAAQLNGKIYG